MHNNFYKNQFNNEVTTRYENKYYTVTNHE